MSRPSWNKILADLWENKARTLLVVISIAVGVFAVGTIAGAYVMIPADMNASYAAANPDNIELWTDPFDQETVSSVRRLDGVADAEGRRVFSVRVRVSSREWTVLQLTALPDPTKVPSGHTPINRLVPEAGAPFPDEREVVLTPKAAAKLKVRVGDVVQVELPDDTARTLVVAGIARNLTSGIGGVVSDVSGFVAEDSLEWLHQPEDYNRLLVTLAQLPNDRAHIEAMATRVTDHLERGARQVTRTDLSRRNEHPLQSIVAALLAVLGILGVLIVFLSGSLIANTLSSLLAQHLRQIGVMKLIGAHSWQIIAMYLALILAFGSMALLIAIPSGAWGAYALSKLVAGLVNFTLRRPTPPPVVPLAVVIQAVIALAVPLLAGILPVSSGSRISVQRALSGPAPGAGRPRRNAGRMPAARQGRRVGGLPGVPGLLRLSRPVLLAIRNTFRRKGRLALTLFTLSLGGAIFIAVFKNQVSLNLKVASIARYFRADVNLDMARLYRVEEVEPLVLAVPGVRAVEPWAVAGAQLQYPDGRPEQNVSVLGPPAESALVVPILLQGRWIVPGDQNAITVSDSFWDDQPGLRPGDMLRLKINGQEEDWQVVGIFQFSGTDDMIAFANGPHLAQVLRTPNRTTAYRVITSQHDLAFQQEVAARLDAQLRAAGLRVSKAEAGGAFTSSVTELLGILTTVLLAMALLTAIVGSIGLAGTLGMNILERTREIGVLRAIGADNQTILRLVILEGLTLGLLSYLLAALLSFPITLVLSNVISQAIFSSPADNAVAAQGFGLWLGVVLLLATAASLLPARNATRLTIREVLAYE